MTVVTNKNFINHDTDGVAVDFVYDFEIQELSHTKIYLDGVPSSAPFTVTGLGDPAGGIVTFTVAPPTGKVLSIYREVPITQETRYRTYGRFPGPTFEEDLDKSTFIDQQLAEMMSRTIVVLPGQGGGGQLMLPPPEKDAVLGWDDTESFLINSLAYQEAMQRALQAAQDAEDTLAEFKEMYHGPLAVPPTVGVNEGDIYWGIPSKTMMVFNGTNWEPAAGQSTLVVTETTAVDGDTTFSVAYEVGKIFVIHNGYTLPSNAFTATDGATVTVHNTLVGDDITAVTFGSLVSGDYYTKVEVDDKFSELMGRNLLINGGFNVWQRGTSFDATGLPIFTADRWKSSSYGTFELKSNQGFDASRYAISIHRGGVGASLTQFLESRANATYSGKKITMSLYIKTESGAAPVKFQIARSNGFDMWTSPTVISNVQVGVATTNIQRFTYIFDIPDLGDDAISCGIVFPDKTDVTKPMVTGWQLEEGEVATEFERLPVSLTEMLCYRYYQKRQSRLDGYYGLSGTGVGVYETLPVSMRKTPTVVFHDAATPVNLTGTKALSVKPALINTYGIVTAAGRYYWIAEYTLDAEL